MYTAAMFLFLIMDYLTLKTVKPTFQLLGLHHLPSERISKFPSSLFQALPVNWGLQK